MEKTVMLGNRPILLNYLPDILIQYLIDSQTRRILLPEKQSFKALIMYTNIPQFSQIAANYCRNSQEGLENVSNFLNKFIDIFHTTIAAAGGEILKFLNDKLIVMWPPFNTSTDEEVTIVCRLAVQSALHFQRGLFEGFSTEAFKPKVSISFGLGEISILHVGGVQNKVEYLVVGDAMFQALECDNVMVDDNDIVVNTYMLERIRENFMYEQIRPMQQSTNSKGGMFYVIKSILKAHFSVMQYDPMAFKNSISNNIIDKLRPKLFGYIQREFANFINSGQELWGCEYRKVSIIHFNLGINIVELGNEAAISKLHQMIRKIQSSVFEYGGTIYRTLMDQKGLTVIVAFGVYPNSHQEDAACAVYTTFALRKEFRRLGIALSAGIATGMVFSTFIGFERRDIMMLGDPIYVSYLLMLASIREKEKKILMNEETKLSAENKTAFKVFPSTSYKGRLSQERIFEPVEFLEGPIIPIVNFNRFPELHTHYQNMPYATNVSVDVYHESKFMIGRDLQIMRCRELLEQSLNSPTKATIVLVAGSYGAGKSLFARNFMEIAADLVVENEENEQNPLKVIYSSVGPLNRDQQLNGWAKTMRGLLTNLSEKRSLTKEETLSRILRKTPDLESSVVLVKDLLALEVEGTLQTQPEEDLIAKKEAIDIDSQKDIIRIMIAILQDYLEEKSLSEQNVPAKDDYIRAHEEPEEEDVSGIPPLIICLDDMQLHDEISWNLTNRIAMQIKKVFIIGMVRVDEFDTSPERTTMVEEGILSLGARNQNVHKILLEGLTIEEISQYVRKFFGARLSNDSLNKFLLEKTEGNPGLIYSLLQNLARQEFVTKSNDEIILSEKMKMLLKLGDFVEIQSPDIRYKANSSRIDKIDLTQYLLLKLASIVGNKFDLQTLIVINPFKNSLLTHANALKALEGLKSLDVIEIVNERSDRNVIYKISLPFLREVIYQRLPFSIRKQLHRLVAESFQNTSDLQSFQQGSPTTDKLMYHWNLADPRGEESENLSNPTRRAQILQGLTSKIQSGGANSDIVLKTSYLEKKAVQNPSKWMPKFVTLSLRSLKWYESENAARTTPDDYKGMILLQHIYTVRIFHDIDRERRTGRVGIALEVGKWFKGFGESPPRNVLLACKNQEDAEAWYIFVEYARAKAIYDDFLKNFGGPDPYTVMSKSQSIPSPHNFNPMQSSISPYPQQNERNLPTERDPRSSISERPSSILKNKQRETSQNQRTLQRPPQIQTPFRGLNAAKPIEETDNENFKKETITPRNRDQRPERNLNASNRRAEATKPVAKSQNRLMLEEFLGKTQLVFWSHMFTAPVSRVSRSGNLGNHEIDLPLGRNTSIREEKPPSLADSVYRSRDSDRSLRQLGGNEITFNDPSSRTVSKNGRPVEEPFPAGYKPVINLRKVMPSSEAPKNTGKPVKPSVYFNDDVLNTKDPGLLNRDIDEPAREGYKDLRNLSFNPPPTYTFPEDREIIRKPVKQQQPVISKRRDQPKHATHLYPYPEEQEAKKVSKPNIYGKYEMFRSFFSDSYFDNRKIYTNNNQIMKIHTKGPLHKKKILKNAPGRISNMRQSPNDPNTYIIVEEEVDKRPAMSVQPDPRNGLTNEQFNYRPSKKQQKEVPTSSISWYDLPIAGKPQSQEPKHKPDTSHIPRAKQLGPRSMLNHGPIGDMRDSPPTRFSDNVKQPRYVEIDYPYESMNQSVAPDSFASEVESEEPEEPEEEYEEPPRLPSHNIIDILPTQAPPKTYSFGIAKRDVVSQDGDDFLLRSGEFVVITRMYERRRLAECLWQGMIGLFSLDDLRIVQNSKVVQDEAKNVLVHTTPPRKQGRGDENQTTAHRIYSREPELSQRKHTPKNRTLQPTDMNRRSSNTRSYADEDNDFKNLQNFQHSQNSQIFDDNSDANSMISSSSRKPVKMMKRELRGVETPNRSFY